MRNVHRDAVMHKAIQQMIIIGDKEWWHRFSSEFILLFFFRSEFIICCFINCYTGDRVGCDTDLFFKSSIQHYVNGNSKRRAVPCKSLSGVFSPQFRFSIATNAIAEALQPKQQRIYRCQLFYLRAPIFSNGSICLRGILEMISLDWLNDVTNSHDCR